VNFHKYSATGNDFVLLDNRDQKISISNELLFQNICHRKFGIGADGVLLVENSENYDFKMIYINSDGREAEMCANGCRAICHYVKTILNINSSGAEPTYVFETMNGVYQGVLSNNDFVKIKMTEVSNLGKISIDDLFDSKSNLYLEVGVPHCVYEVDQELLEDLNIFDIGKKIRNDKRFTNGVNVNFFSVLGENEVAIRTYERGVEDETLSCGTGATAVAINCFEKMSMKGPIHIQTKGGELVVSKENSVFFLSGQVVNTFRGIYEI